MPPLDSQMRATSAPSTVRYSETPAAVRSPPPPPPDAPGGWYPPGPPERFSTLMVGGAGGTSTVRVAYLEKRWSLSSILTRQVIAGSSDSPGPDGRDSLGRAHLTLEAGVVLQLNGVDVQGEVSF